MMDIKDASALGYDALMISPPFGTTTNARSFVNEATRLVWKIRRSLSLGGPRIVEYSEAIKHLIPDLSQFNCEAYPCVYPNWDNTPRKGRKGVVLQNSTPELFEEHLRDALSSLDSRADDHKIVFLKSWNEWAEGNYLEPDTKWGLQYLKALKRVVE